VKMGSPSEENKVPVTTVWTAVKPFLNGGLSGMGATCVIQPVDMIKVKCPSEIVDAWDL
jgi:solute carrier family 25 oxoglutarate transporter 11